MLKPNFRKIALIGLLALSVVTQSLNGQRWAQDWESQKNFWWQMTWRAPDIRDNTLLIAYLPEVFAFREDYEIWGPANLIYRSGPADYPLIQAQILNRQSTEDLIGRLFLEPHVRDIYVPRYYSNTLIVSQPTAGSCIHVIDGKMPAYSADEYPDIEKVGRYSDLDMIDPSGSPRIPPAAIFGTEPERGWCYYYQQASLARQTGDWSRIGELYDAAAAAGVTATDASEYFVFIEGLTNLGRGEDARMLAGSKIKENPGVKYSLCSSLASAPVYPDPFGYDQNEIGKIICEASN